MQGAHFTVEQDLSYLIGMPAIYENWMDFTNLRGVIPSEIGTVVTLASWSITFCGLGGNIPPEMGNLILLDRLWMYQNSFVGSIPSQLSNLPRLQILYLEGNQLQGTMPNEICALQQPFGAIIEVGADCHIDCPCCTCCGIVECGNFS